MHEWNASRQVDEVSSVLSCQSSIVLYFVVQLYYLVQTNVASLQRYVVGVTGED